MDSGLAGIYHDMDNRALCRNKSYTPHLKAFRFSIMENGVSERVLLGKSTDPTCRWFIILHGNTPSRNSSIILRAGSTEMAACSRIEDILRDNSSQSPLVNP